MAMIPGAKSISPSERAAFFNPYKGQGKAVGSQRGQVFDPRRFRRIMAAKVGIDAIFLGKIKKMPGSLSGHHRIKAGILHGRNHTAPTAGAQQDGFDGIVAKFHGHYPGKGLLQLAPEFLPPPPGPGQGHEKPMGRPNFPFTFQLEQAEKGCVIAPFPLAIQG
jgi:hypothetical protein